MQLGHPGGAKWVREETWVRYVGISQFRKQEHGDGWTRVQIAWTWLEVRGQREARGSGVKQTKMALHRLLPSKACGAIHTHAKGMMQLPVIS